MYGDGDYIIYEGDFSSFQYNGNGIIYFKKNDKYIEGTLYYSEGNKKYEEKFNNNALNGEEAILKKMIKYFVKVFLIMEFLFLENHILLKGNYYMKEILKIIFQKKEKKLKRMN